MLPSRSLISQYVSCVIDGGMTGDDVEVHSLPMYHCAQLDCFFSVDVYLGATSVILPAPEPAALLAAVERERATSCSARRRCGSRCCATPTSTPATCRACARATTGRRPCPWRCSGAAAAAARRAVWNFYGQTEMAPLATILRPTSSWPTPARPVGRDQRRDPARRRRRNPVAPGEVGEIVHRSPHAALGYYEDEEKTAEAFRTAGSTPATSAS
jgi:fatty-acyl-CoA synthase